VVKSLPVYIYVPMDFVHVPVSAVRLQKPIDMAQPINAANEEQAVLKMINAMVAAKKPIVLVDCLAARHGAVQETKQLVDTLDFPLFSTSMGKAIIDETHSRFHGIYNGEVSYAGIKEAVESSDCIVNIGPLLADDAPRENNHAGS
jgi:pyruvate decarboxylase